MNKGLLTKEALISFLSNNRLADKDDFDNLYEVYTLVIETINEVVLAAQDLLNVYINHYVVILYIINEYKYFLLVNRISDKSSLDEEKIQYIASLCADKYLTNEKLNFKSEAFLNRFNPPISTLNLYLNFSLRTLETIKTTARNAGLLKDMLLKSLKMSKCILNLLMEGFETEAFSTWRTLHETECIMLCLVKYGSKMYDSYFEHIKYALAYRNQINNKEEVDAIFLKIKSEMKKYDLKSKDMKKFIEYGYLYTANENGDQQIKLNFRDGVEKLAGLSNYSKVYEMASEIAHSSPLLLLSKRTYYFEVTLLNLYESFFRLVFIYDAFYKTSVGEEVFAQYLKMKEVYLKELRNVYSILRNSFIKRNLKPHPKEAEV